ncbi:hypothetical protein A3K63_04635 [Candidatus Micrarchaeota archaeon RBG_16_49_10]|nr:MAG: hypothetical protein A3K63_04635 [Candidatus Micrarchaeota archaeon RBG_16_49_10]
MKRLLLLAVIMLLPVIVGASTNSPILSAETVFTNPYPLEPGSEAMVTVVVSNNGSEAASGVTIEMRPVYPFTLLENGVKSISLINIGSERQMDYKIFVDSSAVSSTYEIPLIIKYGNSQLEKKVELTVQGVPKLNLADVRTGTATPGSEETVTVELENIGTGKAKRTRVVLSSFGSDIKPMLAGGNVYLDDLNPGEVSEVEFKVLVSQDAEYGVYTGYVNVTYEDESGNELQRQFQVGILVGGEPELQVVKSEIDQKNGELKVEVINIGSTEAIGIKGELYVKDEFFDVDYVTSLKIDKKSTLKFKIPQGIEVAELALSYKGPDNARFEQTESIAWTKVKANYTVAIIVVAVILFLVLRKRVGKILFRGKRR